jgi:arylsulfatase A-like enzyme
MTVRHPNIVFVLSDDHGCWGLGCYGNREIRTPNLDALAAGGMRFDNFFCTSPVCSPARASLLTGRIPSAHGVHDWVRGGNFGDGSIEYLAGQPAYTDALAGAGYICGLSGKWHLGAAERPQKGFAYWHVHQSGGGPYYDAPMYIDGQAVNAPGYVTDVITDGALAFLDRCAMGQRPFYLGVHYTAPHSPWIDNHPRDIVDSYDACPFESCPQEPRHPWSPGDYGEQPVRERLKGYFAAVTAMDAGIGRILRRLDELKLRQNTLVVYLSDNGFNCGHHGIWGKGNGTFPQNMYDTSIKVPAIFSHPGRIAGGSVCEALVNGYDWMPTVLEYAGVPNAEAAHLPGRSFANLLQGERCELHDAVVAFGEYGPVRMIRTQKHKLVVRHPYGPDEFYDLTADAGERLNRFDDPAVAPTVRDLRARLESWFRAWVDPRIDGARQGVTGRGQMRSIFAGDGEPAFHPPHERDCRHVIRSPGASEGTVR